MEIWSGTQFRATWHRVVCPNPPDLEPGQVLPGRKSVVFFMIPNHDVVSGVDDPTESARVTSTRPAWSLGRVSRLPCSCPVIVLLYRSLDAPASQSRCPLPPARNTMWYRAEEKC
jgi:hypothetical protein